MNADKRGCVAANLRSSVFICGFLFFMNILVIFELHYSIFILEGILFDFFTPEKELGSFYNKCLILRALGVFKQKDKLIRNIKLITKIRNFYAHHLLILDELPDENKNRIKELVYLGDESDFEGVPWKICTDEYLAQLQFCGVSTIRVLQNMVYDSETIEISKP